ncbi:hypothetical protein NKG94_30365 [Micromonospora sp. M12]
MLSAQQLAGYVRGWLPHGFCYREHDVAHLRTPATTTVLRTDGDAGREGPDVAYALRWRASDPGDYDVPMGEAHRGLTALASRDRLGAPVLGTGFVPSNGQLIPEFISRDFADLPMPANAALIAYPPEGWRWSSTPTRPNSAGGCGWWARSGVTCWPRCRVSPRPGVRAERGHAPLHPTGRHVRRQRVRGGGRPARRVPGAGDDQGGPVPGGRGGPPAPVRPVAGVPCLVLREEAGWLRMRLRHPNPDAVDTTGAQCQERGVYEAWAPGAEVTDDQVMDTRYAM